MNSLRVRLALWVLLPLTIALSLSIWFSYQDAQQNAQAQQDHRLWTSAQIIAGQIQWVDKRLVSSVPPVALEVFASKSHDQVFFSVVAHGGHLLAGWPNLPIKFTATADSTEAYQDIVIQGHPLRAYSTARDFFDSGKSTQVVVTVAKTQNQLESEARMTSSRFS